MGNFSLAKMVCHMAGLYESLYEKKQRGRERKAVIYHGVLVRRVR